MTLTKEAYKKLNDNTDGVRFIRPVSEYTLQEVIDALTELEGLKIDVKRYFELSHNPKTNTNPSEMRPYIEWATELTDLELHINYRK